MGFLKKLKTLKKILFTDELDSSSSTLASSSISFLAPFLITARIPIPYANLRAQSPLPLPEVDLTDDYTFSQSYDMYSYHNFDVISDSPYGAHLTDTVAMRSFDDHYTKTNPPVKIESRTKEKIYFCFKIIIHKKNDRNYKENKNVVFIFLRMHTKMMYALNLLKFNQNTESKIIQYGLKDSELAEYPEFIFENCAMFPTQQIVQLLISHSKQLLEYVQATRSMCVVKLPQFTHKCPKLARFGGARTLYIVKECMRNYNRYFTTRDCIDRFGHFVYCCNWGGFKGLHERPANDGSKNLAILYVDNTKKDGCDVSKSSIECDTKEGGKEIDSVAATC